MAAALIADDLTGALDSAVPFAARGLATAVTVTLGGVSAARAAGAAVVAITTESRDIAPAAAADAIRQAWAALAPDPPALLFKKLDSRLRGNVAVEIATLAAAAGRRHALVCPAIPAIGRIVRGGHVQGFGVATPIAIAERLAGAGLPCDMPDCLDGAALAPMAARALDDAGMLAVGARGFAEALAARLASPSHHAPQAPSVAADRLLMVIGSRDPITAAQLARLAEARPDALFVPAPDGIPDPAHEAADAPLVILHATGNDGDPRHVATRLAAAARRRIAGAAPRTLFASGGDTASACARALGIPCLLVQGELAEGIPWSLGTGALGRFPFITKSGGFGGSDALVALAARILPASTARSAA